MRSNKPENYLDFIPRLNPRYAWKVNERGRIEVRVAHVGFFATIAQQLWQKPSCTYVELEEMGSFIWQQINGQNSVYEIGQNVRARYGLLAEPLYQRLCLYLRQLERMGFIK